MARINLLPWRETRRKRQQRDFGLMVGLAALLTAAACGGVHFFIEDMTSYQRDRNAYLQGEIKKLDKQIEEIKDLEKTRDKLIARMNVIYKLQSSRPEVVHLFDELVTTIPDGAYLTQVTQVNRSLTLDGRAESNARVSSYMRNIERSEWLAKPELKVVSSPGRSATDLSTFKLLASQAAPKTEGQE